MKRSTQPVFWLLFGAGGMFSALIGAVLVLITGIAFVDSFSYEGLLAFHRHWLGKAFTFAVISLFLWHGAHRIFHSLHDFGVHAKGLSAVACYGVALAGTVTAAAALLSVGF